MKWLLVLSSLFLGSWALADGFNKAFVELTPAAAATVGGLLKTASAQGDKSVLVISDATTTEYQVGNLGCYFQNSDDSVNCETVPELSSEAAQTIGKLLRQANLKGDKSVMFIGGPEVTQYSAGNLDCYFQNSDDSVSCSAARD